MTRQEMAARDWDAVDVVLVTGDAYVDHPSFAMAILGRVLESEGYRVAILAQPDWHSADAWTTFGRPRLAFAVSAGNMDSMINHYTANRKVRNDDAYSPGGQIGRRPDRATLAYCQRARQAYRGVPILTGGVEASMRRIAHYDFWSDKVRRSILLDAKADLLVHGMGERPLLEILARLDRGEPVTSLRDIRGTAYRLGGNDTQQFFSQLDQRDDVVVLPSYEEVRDDRLAFARMTRLAYRETNPYNARALVQRHGPEAVVVNPPSIPLDEAGMDRIYGLPFTRRPHPSYGDAPIPAFEVVKDSVQIHRGCFGGCAFCSLTAHQGRVIQSRSEASIVAEVESIAGKDDFRGTITDLGGPTANMYRMGCSDASMQRRCRRKSCLHPSICRFLRTDHGPLVRLMKRVRKMPGVRNVFIASGVRTDLAQRSTAYLDQLVSHHVGGHLKTAPEHVDPLVLRQMKKPRIEDHDAFARKFRRLAAKTGRSLFLVPYFLSGHPASDTASMIELALYLKKERLRPRQVQDFIPAPFDWSTAVYYTGIDPATEKPVAVPKGERARRAGRALMQYFLPENQRLVRQALIEAGREDLIGRGPECLVPPESRKAKGRPHGAPGATAQDTRSEIRAGGGYRPRRKSAKRRRRRST